MHKIQQKILEVSNNTNLGELTLREIAHLIGETHPQKVKHHINQLIKKGLIKFDKLNRIVEKQKTGFIKESNLFRLPILGTANCGPASFFADENCEGYLQVSASLLPKKEGLFIIRASGNSMNKSNINGKSIDDGDYVIIDSKNNVPNDKDYVVSIISDVANIKRFRIDKNNNNIVLVSESTNDFEPIIIHPDDMETFSISGKVIEVIKKPQL